MKSILITGGSGFFGTGFVKHLLANTDVQRICIYSRGEYRQAQMRQELGNDERLRFFVGDVRDRDRLRRAMSNVEVVVHAAALKRIEVGFYNPSEMAATNVGGAINVVEAARDARVGKVVALSTDKAFEPVSPYGYSKALAESIFRSANDGHGPMFAVTRYGNVAGSTGSIIPSWRALLTKQNWVPVTAMGCTRFWMTQQEAVDLVIDTIGTMVGGELVIPSLPAYKVADLAEAMGAPSVRVIGLPDFEKKHESMDSEHCSSIARRMTVGELREALKQV
jgi:UDP-N-acetylglucosamine 4,6-dehydratase